MNPPGDFTLAQQTVPRSLARWFDNYSRQHKLSLSADYPNVLYAVASWIQSVPQRPLTIGISGAQGSGKSTFAKLLAELLSRHLNQSAKVLSLDDFYHTRSCRQTLARNIHPLLAVRGVPGTHDIDLMARVIFDLLQGLRAAIPVFDKSADDRRGFITSALDPPAVLLLEGWCWGARACHEKDLKTAINALEADKDKGGIWRRYVNDQLKSYQRLFTTDLTIFLKVPDFQSVINWRWAQEQRISPSAHRMTRRAIARFVMHYERITQRMLIEQPGRADVTLALDRQHRFSAYHRRKPRLK